MLEQLLALPLAAADQVLLAEETLLLGDADLVATLQVVVQVGFEGLVL